MALRARFSMWAMGSVMVMSVGSLPAGLAHAGDLPRQRQRAEADAAGAEFPHEGVAAPAQVAARLAPRAELRRHLALGDPAGLAHVVGCSEAAPPARRFFSGASFSATVLRKGMPSRSSRSSPTSLRPAVVTMVMFIPWKCLIL